MENTQMNTQGNPANAKRANGWLVALAVASFALVATPALCFGNPSRGASEADRTAFVASCESVAPCGRYPYTSQRKVVFNDVAFMSNADLRIMRNEIYARHGYIFDSQDLRDYFSRQSWYRPTTKNITLSELEKYNEAFIKDFENELDSTGTDLFTPSKEGKYPFTAVRKVTYQDIANLSSKERRIMRNEIFARHGYIFNSQDLRDYFMAQDWYHPITKSVNLSEVEKYNVEFIKRYE